jgi:hypothetical protein
MPWDNTGWLGIRNMQLHNPANMGLVLSWYIFTSKSCDGDRGGRGGIVVSCVVQGYNYACPRPAATWLAFLQYDYAGVQPNSLARREQKGLPRQFGVLPIFHAMGGCVYEPNA